MTCKDCALYESCRHGRGFGNSAEKCYDFTARKFKIGDRVVRIEEPCITSKIFVEVGEMGTVIGYSGLWCAPYTVKWDNGVECVSHGKNLELSPKNVASQLKRCPFCGGKAKLIVDGLLNNFYSVQCEYCGASTESIYEDTKSAILSWNRRFTEKAQEIEAKEIVHLTPCNVCKYNPPSSRDGKPCLICPACVKMDEEEQK